MIVRSATLHDLPRIMELEILSYKNPWNERMMHDEIAVNSHAHVMVLEHQDVIIGYSCFWIIDDEAMLNKLTVDPLLRGRGLGRLLLKDTIQRIHSANALRITLEVRVTNTVAQMTYKAQGFVAIGNRKKYYDDGEDAIVMLLQLREGEPYEEVYCRN